MTALGIRADVERMFTTIGWRPYAAVYCPVFVELVREFYVTFEFVLPTGYSITTLDVIRFRLMGQQVNFFITQFNLVFGFIDDEYANYREYAESACNYVESFFSFHMDIWNEVFMDGDCYDPNQSKSFYLKDPSPRYV